MNHRRAPPAEVELFPDFDPNSTQALDETIRNLRALRERSHSSEEERRWQLKAFEDLQRQVEELQRASVALRDGMNERATKAAFARFEKALGEKMDKRADTLRNTVLSVLGFLVMLVLALLNSKR